MALPIKVYIPRTYDISMHMITKQLKLAGY